MCTLNRGGPVKRFISTIPVASALKSGPHSGNLPDTMRARPSAMPACSPGTRQQQQQSSPVSWRSRQPSAS